MYLYITLIVLSVGRFPALCTKHPRVRGNSRELFLVRLLYNENSVIIMFEDYNRTSRRGILMLPRYNKTIVARCDWGPWVLDTRGGKMAHSAWPRVPFPPSPWTLSQRASIVYCRLNGHACSGTHNLASCASIRKPPQSHELQCLFFI